jgi:hypothetical protein
MTVTHGDGIGPEIMYASLLIDAYRCRFTTSNFGTTSKKTVDLLGRVLDQGLEIAKPETLPTHKGVAGYTLSQGQ